MVDLDTIEALYDNVRVTLERRLWNRECGVHFSLGMFQRAQPDELEKIRRHYETSQEEDVKLLDKPEQSVSPTEP